tara:strand:+ start:163 stop:342 length:180 start_codon:yes stop_codon:yes gene_type:complete
MDPSIYRLATKQGMIRFYKDQLLKFQKVGIGNETEFKVLVTEKLITVTKKRLDEVKRGS